MRHVLRALGSNDLVEISEAEFAEVSEAQRALVAMIGIEQKFELLLENYTDYERELLELSLHQSLRRGLDWHEFQDDIAAVSRRLANLLSAARLYRDQISYDLRELFGPSSDLPDRVKSKMSEQYDTRFGYRVMEALRNVMQHRSMPVHALSYPGESVDDGLRFRAVPAIEIARLKDAEVKPTILAELETQGKSVPLTPLVREYVEGFGSVHESLRELTACHVASWDTVVASMQARGVAPSGGGAATAVLAMRLGEGGHVVETVQLFADLTEYRRRFERRNSVLSRLAQRYVSSVCSVKHDA